MSYTASNDPATYASNNPDLVQSSPTFWQPAPLPNPTQPLQRPLPAPTVVSEVAPQVWGALKFNEFVNPGSGYTRKALVVGGASFNPYYSVPPPVPTEGQFLGVPPSKWAGDACTSLMNGQFN